MLGKVKGSGKRSKKRSNSIHLRVSLNVNGVEDNDYYKNLGLELEGKKFWANFKSDLQDRVNIYEKRLDQCLNPSSLQYTSQKNFTADLIQDYAHLISTGERNKKEHLKQLESKLSEGLVDQEVLEIDKEAVNEMFQKLSRTREARSLERQRLVNEPAFSESWTDVETLNLLKGVAKYGEHSWSDLCDKYDFQAFRTANSLADKWRQLKILMLEDIQHAYNARGITLTKWEWIQGFIRKLEIKCGFFISRQQSAGNAGGWPRNNVQKTIQPRVIEQRQEETKNNHDGIKWQNTIQQLCNNYMDCMGKFKDSIEAGSFDVEEVKKYVAGKDRISTYPKYFELHHISPKVEETRKAVFKLHSKEEVEKARKVSENELKEQPMSLKKLFLQKAKAHLNHTEQKEDHAENC